jgi:hypothetical protein
MNLDHTYLLGATQMALAVLENTLEISVFIEDEPHDYRIITLHLLDPPKEQDFRIWITKDTTLPELLKYVELEIEEMYKFIRE